MSDHNMNSKAVEAVKQFFKAFLVERDFNSFYSMFDENISWLGTGETASYNNSKKLIEALEEDSQKRDLKYSISKEKYSVLPMGDEFCTVCGQLNLLADGLEPQSSLITRFSIVCHLVGENIKFSHIHFSLPTQRSYDIDRISLEVCSNIINEEKEHATFALDNQRFCMSMPSEPQAAYETSSADDAAQENLIESESFKENISEVVFRILYESPQRSSTINSVLSLVGKHYNLSRVYIYENIPGERGAKSTFGWIDRRDHPDVSIPNEFMNQDMNSYSSNFNSIGIFYEHDMQNNEVLKENPAFKCTRSSLQFPILQNGHFVGFVGFDEFKLVRSFSKIEVSHLRNIANLLAIFIVEMRMNEIQHGFESVLDGMHSHLSICDPSTCEILFINNKIKAKYPNVKHGDLCYKSFFGRDKMCEICPMRSLSKSGALKCSLHLPRCGGTHSPNLVTASWVNLVDGRRMCLIEKDLMEHELVNS